jgi:hypothetical protein
MRRVLTLLGAVALAVALSIPVAANTNEPVHWAVHSTEFDQPVEQQAPAINPTGCVWDPDDWYRATFIGAHMLAGATVTGSICEIADWSPHLVFLTVPNIAGLSGTITLNGYISLTVGPGQTGCITGPKFAEDSPLLSPIPDSNGGVGEVETVSFSLTNGSGKRLRDVIVWAKVEPIYAWSTTPCPWPQFTYGTQLFPAGHDPQVWTWLG